MPMLFVNSGTTNTRCYLIRDKAVLHTASMPVGSRNTVLDGNNLRLVEAIRSVRDEVLKKAGAALADIKAFYLSGMVSSPSGLVEVAHLPTPVSFHTLRESMYAHEDKRLFHKPVHIIPGIRTAQHSRADKPAEAEFINIMRGEEIEAIGALSTCPGLSSAIMVFPGSHTQIVFIEKDTIVNILSTVTGELFAAIAGNTILASSFESVQDADLDAGMICFGYDMLHRYGFNRAIYIVRTMDMFTNAGPLQRASYMEGVLNGGVLDAIMQVQKATAAPQRPIMVCGNSRQYQVLRAIAERNFENQPIEYFSDAEQPFAVRGLLRMVGKEAYE